MFILLMCIAGYAQAQRQIDEQSSWSLKDRIYVGGGFGLNGGSDTWGNKYFTFSLSPVIGYMITPNFSAGSGISYTYLGYSSPVNVTIHQYGISPFVRYNIKQFFGQLEYNVISTPLYIDQSNRKTYDRLLAGIGISQPVGDRTSLNLVAMYDLIYSNDRTQSPFASPWVFRVFFTF
jgi:hypothetical protein